MQCWRTSVKKLLNKFWDGSTSGPVLGERGHLLLGGDFSSDEQPEESLWKRLGATRSLWKKILALRDGLSTETDTLLCK